MSTEKCMRLYTSPYGDLPSFAAYPISKDAPFLNLVFNPRDKSLAVIGTALKQGHTYEDKIDDNGFQELLPQGKYKELQKKHGYAYPFKRVRLSTQVTNEYLIVVREEQIELIEKFCENASIFNFLQIIDAPAIEQQPVNTPFVQVAEEQKKEGLTVVQE